MLFLHYVNVSFFILTSCGYLFYSEYLVPEMNHPSRGAIRSFGAVGLIYGLLASSLGQYHHGCYCLTMTLHFILASINVLETYAPENKVQYEKCLVLSGFHYAMFSLMILILVNGGIGVDEHARTKKH